MTPPLWRRRGRCELPAGISLFAGAVRCLPSPSRVGRSMPSMRRMLRGAPAPLFCGESLALCSDLTKAQAETGSL